jgi:hypothetical protein
MRRLSWRSFAVRLPNSLKPRKSGELIEIDTPFANIASDKPIKRFADDLPFRH